MHTPKNSHSRLGHLQQLELALAITTALVVAYLMLTTGPDTLKMTAAVPLPAVVALLGLIIGYVVLDFFWHRLSRLKRYQHPLFAIAFLATCGLILLYESTFVSILMILMVGRAAHHYSLPMCLALAIVPTLCDGLIDHFAHQIPYAMASAVLYILFNLAILVISYALKSEQAEKERSRRLLRELQATQYLLGETAKQDERLHISRELHDQVGHHLTALSLQLEVAIHADDESARPHVQRARDISSLLLSDIRSTLNDIRRSSRIDLKSAIESLLQPGDEQVTIAIDDALSINSPAIAETLFRCTQEALTNARRHSSANEIHIRITGDAETLSWAYRDNGQAPDTITPGNGLIGMRERIQHLGGTLSVNASSTGFQLRAAIPQEP
ncbi:sensor histidine kinase [Gilvimarinus algae]|uniref:histidine kinase n=1 Tax=Gilvimarinus algae TaxID=3058037 RepID=A0ABT8T9H3_9GAMM|nr:sensor histidine kinase [Gilvimarinus sp. SDUM040014]MDO3380765.1 sensor histidine kinase [Gilvimarinus sp. SDUM040014]